jgi:Domain of unknown function (DUF4157)
MNSAFARASRPLASAARNLTDAGPSPGSVSARPVWRQLRPSQQPTGAPVRGVVMPPGGMRSSQIAGVRPGVTAAIPPVSSPAGGSSAGLRPSQGVLLREGDGGAKLRIQRCGIGSSCNCPPRDKLIGIEHDLQRATAAGGKPLPATSREHMENAFSSDFAAVRVHTGAAAHNAASALGARALTAGTDILFRADEYQPGTQGGDRLLAHELAHVVQPAHGLPQGILDTGATDHLEKAAGLSADHASPAGEREARGAAKMAAMGEPVPALSGQPLTVARKNELDAGLRGGVGISPAAAGASPPAAGAKPPAAGASPPAADACPAGQKVTKATACIQPVVIAKDDGTSPTTAPSFDKVVSIWKKACIDYTIKAKQTVKKTAYRTLDESADNTPTAEETDLFDAAGESSCIQVFVPVDFEQGGKTGKDISGGGGTYYGGMEHPKIVVVEGAVSEVVAHEVGHASGYHGHDADKTVMMATNAYNTPNSTDVSADVCKRARSGAVLKIGTADCCEKIP